MADEKKGTPKVVPQSVCSACKAQNEMGALMCKRCGEILSKKGRRSAGEEFDATEGSFSPNCILVPLVLLLAAGLLFFLAFRGPAKGTCGYNREKLQISVLAYNKAHRDSKMMSLDQDALMKPDNKGKSHLKERMVCPVDPSAQYQLNGDGKVSCSRCTK